MPIPHYSELRRRPSRGLPAIVCEMEQGPEFQASADALLRQILAIPPPPGDAPTMAALAAEGGLASLVLPDSPSRAILMFTSPLRAEDYREVHGLADTRTVRLSITGVLDALREAERGGNAHLCLNRCPRCELATVVSTRSVHGIDQLWTLISIDAATERTRMRLYFDYALHAVGQDRIAEALDLVLEALGHVTLEEPNLHLLAGQLGVATGNAEVATDAARFLDFLRAQAHARKLAQVIESGVADFRGVGSGPNPT